MNKKNHFREVVFERRVYCSLADVDVRLFEVGGINCATIMKGT